MKQAYRAAQLTVVFSVWVMAFQPWPASAETPGEIPQPWTYEGSKKLQEQERQRDQQFQPPAQGGAAIFPGSGAAGAGAAAAEAARRKWQQQPALPAERNPLLGKSTRPASTRANPNDPFGPLQALATGGLGEALFGGVFEFRPDRLVGMDESTREQEFDRVEYRGGGKHVVVVPKTTLKLIEFDFDGSDRVHWTGQNCTLVRVGAGSNPASGSAPAKVANAAPAATAGSRSGFGGVLTLALASTSSTDNVAGRTL
jgi:hypothetical protein